MRVVLLIGVFLGVFVACGGEASDGQINIDIPVDDLEENERFIEDVLGEVDEEFEDDDDEFLDAPDGDDTGDLSSKDRDDILKQDDGNDIVRDEEHVVKAVREELDEVDFEAADLDEADFEAADLDELESILRAAERADKADGGEFLPDDVNTGQRVYKDIEAARKAIYDRDKYDVDLDDFNDANRDDDDDMNLPDDGDPEMKHEESIQGGRFKIKAPKLQRLTDEELSIFDDADDGDSDEVGKVFEETPDAEEAATGGKTPREIKKAEELRMKQRRIRRVARLREMSKDRSFNGTLDLNAGSRANPKHDPDTYSRVKQKANEILAKQRQRRKYSQGKHKVTATVKIDPMITIKGGKFRMGTNDPSSTTGEYPVRNMAVKPFKLDRYPVTNGDYAIFKRKKFRYKTDAERRGFSWVFYLNLGKSAQRDTHRVLTGEPWWFAVKNATYAQPGGDGSSITERLDYPAVHVSYHDAAAFCLWAGKRLPTEYEWEYASRGGKNGIRYPWGDRFERNRTNLWQGLFPMENKRADGHAGLSPVNAYKPQNDYGLYDIVGNVWEWTSSQWSIPRRRRNDPAHEEDPDGPKRHVARGGSFIDSRDGSINYEARCGNRKPVPVDFTIENLGFRCAQTIKIDPRRAKKQKVTTTPAPKTRRPPKVHRLKDTWTYKMKAMLEDIIHGGKESASTVMERLRQMRKKEEL